MLDVAFKPEGKTLSVEGVFNAPRQRVWQAWSDPTQLAKWWGPRGWETTIKKFDFKPGGIWHYGMKCVDENQGEFFGQESWGIATFSEINAPENFSYVDQFSDSDGKVNEEMPTMPIKMVFEELPGGRTKISSFTEFDSEEDLKKLAETGMEQGLRETWERLAEMVEKS